jgi:hypothetical protein
MATEYVIPDAVMEQIAGLFTPKDSALAAQGGAWEVTELVERVVRAAARLIVAAERRGFADELDQLRSELFAAFVDECPGYSYHSPTLTKIQNLRGRTTELRGEASDG